jgi:hypothetical protein
VDFQLIFRRMANASEAGAAERWKGNNNSTKAKDLDPLLLRTWERTARVGRDESQ